MIRSKLNPCFILAVLLLVSARAEAQLVFWDPADGGNGHYYQLVDSGLSWTAAEAAAQTLSFEGVSGHLVSISSQQENDFVFDLLVGQGNAWIGLNDLDVEGDYVWTTGEPLDFVNWAAGEPNDAGAVEDAVVITLPDGQWNDLPTTQQVWYVVEFDTPFVEKYITTIVGGPIDPLDGVPATQTRISGAADIVVGPDDRVYYSDYLQNRIRVIDPADGNKIETYAGNGIPGYSGDGGAATQARLNSPGGLAFDSAGHLFFGDTENRVIRRVDKNTGIITTVAGTGTGGVDGENGDALAAQLNSVAALEFDAADNLIAGEFVRILRIDAATNIVTRIAGNWAQGYGGDGGLATEAPLNGVYAIQLEDDGSLVFVDGQNLRVRRVDSGTGIISTIAGTGDPGSTGDGGPAVEAELMPFDVQFDLQGNLLIADVFGNSIRRIDKDDGSISTIAGNGTGVDSGDGGPALLAGLAFPSLIAMDGNGNLLIGGSSRFRVVDTEGNIHAFAGGVGPKQVADHEDSLIEANLNAPAGLALDDQGRLVFADNSDHVLRRLDPETGLVSLFAGNHSCGSAGIGGPALEANVCRPFDLAFMANQDLLVSTGSVSRILLIDGATNTLSNFAGTTFGYSGDGGPAIDAQLANPAGLAVHASGDVYIADSRNNRIRRVSAVDGIISTIAGDGSEVNFPPPGPAPGDGGPAVNATLSQPNGLAIYGDSLYIAEWNNPRVRLVDLQTGIITTYAGTGSLAATGDGGPATLADLGFLDALEIDEDGNLLISTRAGSVRKVDRVSGIITTILGNGQVGFEGDGGPPLQAQFAGLGLGLLSASGGELYLSDTWNQRIRKVAPTSPPCIGVTSIPTIECEALNTLYLKNGGDGWTNNTNWLTNDDPATWHDVTVSGGHVTVLDFLANNLTGQLPPEIGHFPFLENLELSQNNLTGTLPRRMGGLGNLGFLSMWQNDLTGQLPHTLGNLGELYLLQIGNNDFTGGVPSTFGRLGSLQFLYMAGNPGLSGVLPPTLINIPDLIDLNYSLTNLCQLTTAEFVNWISGVDSVIDNGRECDEVAFEDGFDKP